MNFRKTILRGDKRGAIHINAKVKYEIFGSFEAPSFIKENNVFAVDEGNKFYDLIIYQDPWNFAISERFKNLLEEYEITGWDCYPIVIEGVDLKYYGFQVIGRAGIIREYDEDGFRVYGTTYVDINTWDGSDIFSIGDTGITIITPKVEELLLKYKITNIEIEDLSKY